MADATGDALALGRGLLLGDDSDFSQEAKGLFRSAGIQHLTAASGANLAFVRQLALFVLFPWSYWLKLAGETVAYGAYWQVAGGSGSLWRATLMIFLVCGGKFVGRRLPRWYAMALVFLLGLVTQSQYFRTTGFWLSSAAMLGLMFSQKTLSGENKITLLPQSVNRFRNFFFLLYTSTVVSVAVLPLLWIYFGSFSVLSAFATPIADPFLAPMQVTALSLFGSKPFLRSVATAAQACLVWQYRFFVSTISGFTAFSGTLTFALLSDVIFLLVFTSIFRVFVRSLRVRRRLKREQLLCV